MSIKLSVIHECTRILEARIKAAQTQMDELTESLKHETKSTAGDKHETARAFIHIEQANVGHRLQELSHGLLQLQSINFSNATNGKVVKGSLVYTNKGVFFIGVAIGKINVNNTVVYTLSPNAPLGQKLMGAMVGHSVNMNNVHFTIDSIE